MPDEPQWTPEAHRASQDLSYFAGCMFTDMQHIKASLGNITAAAATCRAERESNEKETFRRTGALEKIVARMQGAQEALDRIEDKPSRSIGGLRLPSLATLIKLAVFFGLMIGGAFSGCLGAKVAMQSLPTMAGGDTGGQH